MRGLVKVVSRKDIEEADWSLFVVDVKGGESVGDPELVFNRDRITDAIERAGHLIPDFNTADVINELCRNPHYHRNRAFVGKMYIAQSLDGPRRPTLTYAQARYEMMLRHAVSFIRDRFKKYEEKQSDWNRFPSELAQFLIWHDKLCPPDAATVK